ncbi:Asp23/Gls24 family envelope stress response protein [Bombilactobacillus folatiphilus]|uniref:Asp23/Gls24 family envelope stress response protein n=1 Tax=Bombilactobacillus folatiphilus TaxID=2923362 RepID=A0ABY4P7P5_9LACO|nr:Asp23/Gls24 family envelope stress response protein [Bombilactobacillus folatiphilus]UQS81629.1 Asp23/Gls24 family envelope stress response protein [Bombilactobacillus folatiphilus]
MADSKYLKIDPVQADDLGEVHVTTDVLEALLGIAATKVNGVFGMRGTLANNINALFGHQSHGKGVSVSYNDEINQVSATVYVYLEYGISVPKVALELQKSLSQQLKFMTDLTMTEVNVQVVGLVAKRINEGEH